MKVWLASFLISLATVVVAQRQLVDITAELPLATVGEEPGGPWLPQGDEFEFTLTKDTFVRLWIYSPSIDRTAMPGNERYSDEPLESEFILLDPNRDWRRTSGRLPEGASSWLVLHEGTLPAGRYVLQSLVYGAGKNVFLPILEIDSERRYFRSVRPTINVSSSTWQPAVSFVLEAGADNCTLYNYDGDHPDFLEALIRLPNGSALPLTISPNLDWATDVLPPQPGAYMVLARIPEGAFQMTNAVRFMVICDDEAVPLEVITEQTLTIPDPILPVEVHVIDTAGVPLEIPFTLEGEVERRVTLSEDGDYRLVEVQLEGGEPIGEREVRFGRAGGRVTFVLERIPEFAVPRPDIRLHLIPARPLPMPEPVITLTTEPAPEPARLVLERSLSDSHYLACEIVTVTLTVRNEGETAGRFILLESLPNGVTLVDANGVQSETSTLRWQGELSAGEHVRFSYQMLTTQESQLNLIGTLLSDDGADDALVRDEALLTRLLTETTLLRTAPEGDLFVGDTVTLLFTVSNPLARPVTLRLPSISARVTLLEAPETLELPAEGVVSVPITLTLEQPGAAIVQLGPTACASEATEVLPSGNPVSWREDVLVLPELPPQTLRTIVTIDMAAFDLPRVDGLVLVQALPEGVRYVAGSTLIDGESASEPEQVEGALIFNIPDTSIATLSFTALHNVPYTVARNDSSLIALTPEPELLIGEPLALERYLNAKRLGDGTMVVQRERVGAVILSPADGQLLASGLATIIVDTPLDDAVTLLVNGELVDQSRIGVKTRDSGLMRQTFEYLGVRLQPGPNELVLTSRADNGAVQRDSVKVFAPGQPERITFTPITPLVAGTVTPLRLLVTVSDAWGNAPADSFVTIEVAGSRPAKPDANPQQLGYQLAFRNGRAELWLEPVPEATELSLTAIIGQTLTRETLTIGTEARPWIVSGYASVGAHLGTQGLGFGVSASVFARGRVFEDSLLTIAANYPLGALGLYGNPFEQFPLAGASGNYGAAALSRHGVYARLERHRSYLQYGDFVTQLEGGLLNLSRSYTGLSGQYRPTEHGFAVRGYLALAAVGDRVRDLELSGNDTRVYQLPQRSVKPGSLTLEVIKRDGRDPRRLIDDNDPLLRVLTETIDYVLDARVGIIRLTFRLPEFDAQGNRYFLRANYQLDAGATAERRLQFGAQAFYNADSWRLRAGVVRENGAGNTFTEVIAAGAAMETGGLTGDVELAYGRNQESGGLAALLRVGYSQGPVSAEARYQFTAEGYRSSLVSDIGSAGHSAAARLSYAFTPGLAISADVNLSHTSVDGATNVSAGLFAVYQSSARLSIGERQLGTRPGAQFGVQFDDSALRAVVGGSLNDIFGLSGTQLTITHRQGLTADSSSITEFSVAFRLLDNLALRLTDRLEWGRRNLLLIGLEAGFSNSDLLSAVCRMSACELTDPFVNLGTTRVTVQYELEGGVSGRAGRVRLGVDTTYPLSDAWIFEGAMSQTIGLTDSRETVTALSAGVRYDTETLTAEAAYDIRFGVSIRQAGFIGVTAELSEVLYGSVTADYLSDSDPDAGGRGFKVAVAAAYRGDRTTVLANHTLRSGLYTPEGELELAGDTRVTVPFGERWSVQAGYLYRFDASLGFQHMLTLGVSAHLWDGGAVSGYGRLLHDWRTQAVSFGTTLEVGQLLGCGVYGVAGLNLLDGVGRNFGATFYQPGFFVRADIVFDEAWRCGVGSIGGRVIASAPISGVMVVLLDDAARELARTMTSADGSYRFEQLTAGRYQVLVQSPYGYKQVAAMVVALARAERRSLPDLVLERE